MQSVASAGSKKSRTVSEWVSCMRECLYECAAGVVQVNVVEAFDQSLSNMSRRLQRLTVSSNLSVRITARTDDNNSNNNSIVIMGVDHSVHRGTCPPTFWSRGDVSFVPPLLFKGTHIYYVLDLLNDDCFSIIMHSKAHLICLAAGLRSDRLRGELTALARPQLLATENRFKESGTKKEGIRKNKGKEKASYSHPKLASIIACAFDVWYSCTEYIDVTIQYGILLPCPFLLFCLGRRPWL